MTIMTMLSDKPKDSELGKMGSSKWDYQKNLKYTLWISNFGQFMFYQVIFNL